MENLIGTGHGKRPYPIAQREFTMGGNFLRCRTPLCSGIGFRGFLSCTPKQITCVGIGRHCHLR